MAGIFDIFTGQSGVDAANAQIAGINSGQTAATTALNQGVGALNTNYSAALQPFTQNYQTAQGGVNALGNALGLNGAAGNASATAAFQNNPGYQFQLQQGDQNVLRNQAQTGQLNSGATNLDLQAQGQGLANQTYQQYVQNLQPYLGQSNAAASGIANVDTGLGNALNSNYGSQANLGYTAATGIGNANANADLAQGKGIANLWGAGLSLASAAAGMPSGSFSSPPGGVTNGGPLSAIGNANVTPGFNAYAEGGKPPVGQPSVVGEKGPELFVPDQPGTVVPNDLLQRLLQFLPGQSLGGAAGGSSMTYDSGQALTPNDYVSEGFKAHDPSQDYPTAAPSRKNEPRPFQWPPHIGPSSALSQFLSAA
jgi:hypothetical protein